MRIIQSFAVLKNDSHQYVGNKLKGNEVYLNFYTFLLSYLTLKKYYGNVTMYCNKEAYDRFIRYIPYDEIILLENSHNNPVYWSYYKVQVMNQMSDAFIHVDSDVFIFDDLFKPFIDGDVEGIVQDRIPASVNFTMGFINDNKVHLPKGFDGGCYSCGVVGMTKDLLSEYRKVNLKMYDKVVNGKYRNLQNFQHIICGIIEELGFYITCFENKTKIHEILPYEEIVKEGGDPRKVGNSAKYTHMWFSSKFMKKYIDLIKIKITKEYPQHADLIEIYEKEVIEVNNVKML